MTLPLKPVIDRLEAEVSAFRTINDVLALSLIDQHSYAAPAAFVAPLSETAADNASTSGVRQVVTHRFGVLCIIEAKARARGAAPDALAALLKDIDRALVGWRHPDAISDAVFRAGRLFAAAEGRVAWLKEFELRTQETSS